MMMDAQCMTHQHIIFMCVMISRDSDMSKCPFCDIEKKRIIHSGLLAVVVRDGFPISPGHSLIIPKRHYASFFEARPNEIDELYEMLLTAKTRLKMDYQCDGFNIGINDGLCAGQTVGHLHIHLIPRYDGDVEDPRGGVRWVIPEKAKYWSEDNE